MLKNRFLIGLLMCTVLSGCVLTKPASVDVTETPSPVVSEDVPTPTSSPTATAKPDIMKMPDTMGVNTLTGNLIDKEIASRRPFAVVINNMKKALPQSGISQADMYYEVLSEGDITRIIAVFKVFTSEKIGPIRSARDYFLLFALDNDAVFIHHGGSDKGGYGGAYMAIRTFAVNNIDGMKYDGSVFKRDPVRVNQSGMYEHSSYTAASRLLEKAEELNYMADVSKEPLFRFYDVQTAPKGETAETVSVPFSTSQDAHFVFDKETGKYSRYQFGMEHIDEETGEILTVDNVIIQYADISLVQGDVYGRRIAELISEGDGLLITNGTYAPIKWSKKDYGTPTVWTDESGDMLTINKGKTWVCVVSGKTPVTIS